MRLSAESVYEALIDEEDARACADIPESACRETPRSFVLILVSQLFTKLGDMIGLGLAGAVLGTRLKTVE